MRCRLVFSTAVLSITILSVTLPASSFLRKPLGDWHRELTQAGSPARRRSAAFALGRMGTLSVFALADLARILRTDPDEGVRDMAACAIGDIVLANSQGAPRREWDLAGESLQQALTKDSSPRVRRSVVYALGAFGDLAEAAAPSLRLALRDPVAAVRQNAAWALGRIDSSAEGMEALCSCLEDAEPLVRRDTALALGQLASRLGREKMRRAAAPLMTRVTKETDRVVLKSALGALVPLTDETHRSLASSLYPLLDHKDPEVSRSTAFALGAMGGEPTRRALPQLRAALVDPDPDVQALTAASLTRAGASASEALDDLARTLERSKSPVVRKNCAIAIARIGESLVKGSLIHPQPEISRLVRASIPALEAALKPPAVRSGDPLLARANEEVRECAAEALGRIGFPYNEPALGTVREMLRKEPNQNLRQRCVWTLYNCRDLDRLGMTPVLTTLLTEKSDEGLMVRYDTARVLAWALRDRAPDKTAEVLLHMIRNRDLRVFHGSGTQIEGVPQEGKTGSSKTTYSRGGDARYMAAQALGWLGEKSRKNKAIMEALRAAARESDTKLKNMAQEALSELENNN